MRLAFSLAFLLFSSISLHSAASQSPSYEELEARIEQLEKDNHSFASEIHQLFTRDQENQKSIQFSGFITAALATVDTDDNIQWGNEGPDDELDWNSDSIVGLQARFLISDKLSAVTQLVSKGGFSSDFDADWFYLKYNARNDLDILLGRVRPQFFMLSDYVEVGFTYPWIRPPVEVYDPIPSDVGQGISVNYRTKIKDWRVSSFFQFLQMEDQGTVSQFDSRVLLAAIEFTYGDWTLGLRKSNMKVDILLQSDMLRLGSDSLETVSRSIAILPREDSDVQSGNISLRFDDGTWLLLGEWAYFDLEGLFVDSESFYLTLGHRFNNWLPHLTFSKLYSTDDKVRSHSAIETHKNGLSPDTAEHTAVATIQTLAPLLWNQKSSAYTLGVNYFFTPQVVGKLEAKLVTDRKGTVAHFQNAATNSDVIPVIPSDDSLVIYGLSVDLVF